MKAKRKSPQVHLKNVMSFFDENFVHTSYFKKASSTRYQTSKRNFLKSALGVTAIGASVSPLSKAANITSKLDLPTTEQMQNAPVDVHKLLSTDPWKTLDSVLQHLLPVSSSNAATTGPSANDIQATQYLINVVYQQPTASDEISFIYNGVGWLNDFSQSQHQENFIHLSNDNKESLLKKISRSSAGENWLSNLISYIFEAMLSAPSYGGNPEGIGWQWLEHHSGYPLPPVGKRYFELPGKHRIFIKQKQLTANPQQRNLTHRTKA